MKQLKLYVVILLLTVLVIFSVALTIWWNPLGWNVWGNMWNSVFHKEVGVVKEYLTKTQNFDGLDESIEAIKIKIVFSEGFLKNVWETDLFMKEKTRDFGNYMLEEANNLKKLNISDDFNKSMDKEITDIKGLQSDFHQSINNLSIKTLENNSVFSKVQANYEIETKGSSGEQKVSQEEIYVLNFINKEWKIVDLIDKNGVWSETMDYNKIKKDFITSLDDQKEKFNNMLFITETLREESIGVADIQPTRLLSVVWEETFESGSQWSGQRSETIMQSASDAVARITGTPGADGYLFRKITIPADAYYMSYEMKNEKVALQSFLTVTFDNEIISYQNLSKIDGKMRKIEEIFIGDGAGKTDDLLFTVNQVGTGEPSVLIDNIKFYKVTSTLP